MKLLFYGGVLNHLKVATYQIYQIPQTLITDFARHARNPPNKAWKPSCSGTANSEVLLFVRLISDKQRISFY